MDYCDINNIDILINEFIDGNNLNSANYNNNNTTRFFFLKYYSNLSCSNNYNNALIIIFIIVFTVIYPVLFILFCYLDKKESRNQVLLDYLKKEILKEAFPHYSKTNIDKKYEFDKKIKLTNNTNNIFNKKNNVFEASKVINSINITKRNNYIIDYIDKKKSTNELEGEIEAKAILKDKKMQLYDNKKLDIIKLKKRQFDSERYKINEKNVFGYDFYKNLEEVIYNEDVETNAYNKIKQLEKDKTSKIIEDNPIIVNVKIDKPYKSQYLNENEVWKEPEPIEASNYFIRNILKRHVYISPFTHYSNINPRYKRITGLFTYMLLNILIQMLLFTMSTFGSEQNEGLISYSLFISLLVYCLGLIISNLIYYLIVCLIVISLKYKKELINIVINSDTELALLQKWKELKTSNLKKSIIGVILYIFIFCFVFYYLLTFISIWYNWKNTLLYGLLLCILMDLLIFEVIIEIIFSACYSKYTNKNNNKNLVLFNKIRNFRCMV